MPTYELVFRKRGKKPRNSRSNVDTHEKTQSGLLQEKNLRVEQKTIGCCFYCSFRSFLRKILGGTSRFEGRPPVPCNRKPAESFCYFYQF